MSARLATLIFALAVGPAAGAAEITWKEANQRSAAALREGKAEEGADHARQAFELYEASPKYAASNHAQLLLNLLDAEKRARGPAAALKAFDAAVRRMEAKAGPDEPMLVQVWVAGAGIAGAADKFQRSGECLENAAGLAARLFGPGDPRTLDLQMRWVDDQRQSRGYNWARDTLTAARGTIPENRNDSLYAIRLDLLLGKLELEHQSPKKAVPLFRSVIDRLEPIPGAGGGRYLQTTYALLEYTYEVLKDTKSAKEVRERRLAMLGTEDSPLVPIQRVSPQYPRHAFRQMENGSVTMLLTIAPDGSVSDAQVIHSTPAGTFERAALEAVRKWRFKPRVVGGVAIEQTGTQVIEFKLAD